MCLSEVIIFKKNLTIILQFKGVSVCHKMVDAEGVEEMQQLWSNSLCKCSHAELLV